VAQHAVAFAHLFERADGVRLGPRPMPHLFSFYEKRVPVIVVRVRAEDPIVSLNRSYRHSGLEPAELYTLVFKKRNKNVGVNPRKGRFAVERWQRDGFL